MVIFNALMPERFNKTQPAVEYLIPGKNEEFRTYPRHCACAMSYIVLVGTVLAGGPPAQIPACGITALGSYRGCVAAKRASGKGCTVRVWGTVSSGGRPPSGRKGREVREGGAPARGRYEKIH